MNVHQYLERRVLCQKNLRICCLLARNLLFKLCANLIEFLREIILSKEFVSRHRSSPKAFIRQRKLSFQFLILYFINFIKGSYQDELDNFYKTLSGAKVAKRVVTKSALAKARKKLKHEAFIELNEHATEFFYKEFSPLTWQGFRLTAFDGSLIQLPHEPEIAEHFGVWGVRKGEPCPMARLSQMFDPLNKVTIDAIISPKGIGERELAALHCNKLGPDNLALLDRGYPAFWLFKLILSRNAHFCSRISSTKWKIVRKFYRSGKKDTIIALKPPGTSLAKCHELRLNTEPMNLRLIRIELDSGETEILITSLIDTVQYPWDVFSALYHKRWPVEEDYKTMKCRIEIENFSGKSVLSIYQDFHAKVFSKNLTSILAFPTMEPIKVASDNKKYEYQINFTQALSKTKHVIVLLFQRSRRQVCLLISSLHAIFIKTVEPIRPGRKYPRKHKVTRRKYYINYKPIA